MQHKSKWREIIQIIPPSCWLEIEERNSYLIFGKICSIHTKDLNNLNKLTELSMKNFMIIRKLTSGGGWSCNIAPKQAVYEPTEQYHLFYQFLDPGKVKETGKPYDCTGL